MNTLQGKGTREKKTKQKNNTGLVFPFFVFAFQGLVGINAHWIYTHIYIMLDLSINVYRVIYKT